MALKKIEESSEGEMLGNLLKYKVIVIEDIAT
jgi:hypothetical protein